MAADLLRGDDQVVDPELERAARGLVLLPADAQIGEDGSLPGASEIDGVDASGAGLDDVGIGEERAVEPLVHLVGRAVELPFDAHPSLFGDARGGRFGAIDHSGTRGAVANRVTREHRAELATPAVFRVAGRTGDGS